jgi:putative SOS response-associated peptidase YedK
MCLRFALFWIQNLDVDAFLAALRNNPYLPGFEEFEGSRPVLTNRYNVGPTYMTPIIRRNSDGKLVMELAKWGFVPSWATEKPKYLLGNAKAETVATNGFYRKAFKQSRCLIPASGFYEPKGPRAQKNKPWFYFSMLDKKPFMFGGLWSRSHLENDKPIATFTLVTTEPNEIVGEIHDRMPLIINPKDYMDWLAGDDVNDLLQPFPADPMTCWQVGDGAKRLSKADGTPNDDPSMIEPISANIMKTEDPKLF